MFYQMQIKVQIIRKMNYDVYLNSMSHTSLVSKGHCPVTGLYLIKVEFRCNDWVNSNLISKINLYLRLMCFLISIHTHNSHYNNNNDVRMLEKKNLIA